MQCGPLSSVIDFLELIGAESDHTLKIEIVPYDMFYKCANMKKNNFRARQVFVSRVQIGLCSTYPRLGNFCRFCLTLSQFGNAITSWILGVSL
jgi:hypothetical protein